MSLLALCFTDLYITDGPPEESFEGATEDASLDHAR